MTFLDELRDICRRAGVTLKEGVDIPASKYGYWILPDGRYMPVSMTEGHLNVFLKSWAREEYGNALPEVDFDEDPDDFLDRLLENGWIRITAPAARRYKEFGADYEKPTKQSLQALIEMVRQWPENEAVFYIRGGSIPKKSAMMLHLRRMLEKL